MLVDSNHCFKIEIDIPTSYKLVWISVSAFFLKKLLDKKNSLIYHHDNQAIVVILYAKTAVSHVAYLRLESKQNWAK